MPSLNLAPWRQAGWLWWLAAAAILVGGYLAFAYAIEAMLQKWTLEEFSHGYLILPVAAYLAWQQRATLIAASTAGAWTGPLIVLLAALMAVAGRLSSLVTLEQLALLGVILGLVVGLWGWRGARILRSPLTIMLFMIPLPSMIMNNLSAQLQLVSSTLGVWLIRLVGVSVFLEGNVIDLGSYRLEVAEACSGLRYLLPLMTLAFLIAYLYRAPLWKRAIVFISSVPLTVLTNSARIALIGVTVDRWGPAMAEGALHEVQGWMMFMISTVVLLLEVMILSKVGRDRRPWQQAFGLRSARGGTSPSSGPRLAQRALPVTAFVASILLLTFGIAVAATAVPVSVVPARQNFATFPLVVGEWHGARTALDRIYVDALKLDDYVMANYQNSANLPVNLYVAWYDRQSTGESTHSPRACLPGGGWQIHELRQVQLATAVKGHTLMVNRALIQHGDARQLVYYWFVQRDRVVTDEYLVKWYLLVDSLTRHRTDGALVRLIVPIGASAGAVRDADLTLNRFVATFEPVLDRYLPS
jgi:exosortase D (VPLPA-CTERM-specific)